ncbi:MAG: YIP1 family protein [Deltaproteobacteria bacterium]|nr:YIP1 family protein [Deltaproteobacteria bacterium]
MICPKCGKEFDPAPRATELCPECFRNSSGSYYSESLGPNASSLPGFDSNRSEGYCPWEDEEGISFVQGLLQTLRQSVFEPTRFFQRLSLVGGYKFPFLYALVISTISIIAAYLASTIIDLKAMPMSHGMFFMGHSLGSQIYALLILTLQIFVQPAVLFICLLALGVRNATFEAIFRISCYTAGAGIFKAVPFVGSFVAFIWGFVILVIGLREGFRISTGRAIVAIFLPAIAGIALAVLFVMLLMGSLFA